MHLCLQTCSIIFSGEICFSLLPPSHLSGPKGTRRPQTCCIMYDISVTKGFLCLPLLPWQQHPWFALANFQTLTHNFIIITYNRMCDQNYWLKLSPSHFRQEGSKMIFFLLSAMTTGLRVHCDGDPYLIKMASVQWPHQLSNTLTFPDPEKKSMQ